jgi:hypothetical protein
MRCQTCISTAWADNDGTSRGLRRNQVREKKSFAVGKGLHAINTSFVIFKYSLAVALTPAQDVFSMQGLEGQTEKYYKIIYKERNVEN